jgi:hypothetical protein
MSDERLVEIIVMRDDAAPQGGEVFRRCGWITSQRRRFFGAQIAVAGTASCIPTRTQS